MATSLLPKSRLRLADWQQRRGHSRRAFQLLGKAARSGNAEAAFQVGRAYIDGNGVPISLADAAHWLEQAACQGHLEAQALLAELLLKGCAHSHDGDTAPRTRQNVFASNVLGQPDYLAAWAWSRRAAEGGSASGQALHAYILSQGPEKFRDLDAARDWYGRAARDGSAQGHLGYALAIAGEAGREADVAAHLREAADKDIPAAIYLLGLVTERGMGTAVDLPAAADCYRRAAEAGNRAAQSRWGAMLMDGTGVPQDPLTGETWLRRAALAGDPEAATRVGQIYATAGILPPNYVEAANWFERAAKAGDRSAAYLLGLLYLSGSGVALDSDEAARLFRVAAAAGNTGARNDLARLVLKGEGKTEDLASMLLWFRTKADAGDHVTEFNYAVCLAKGFGCPRNDPEAAHYLRRAARHVTSARYWYGMMVAEGRGVPLNLAKARRHFGLAFAAGHAEAASALGELIINGKGGPRDPDRAVTLFRYAAERKHAGAMFALGVVYNGGHGIPADPSEARAWFLSAARLNHAQARQVLGRYLMEGIGGERDVEQARLWLDGAAPVNDGDTRGAAPSPSPVEPPAQETAPDRKVVVPKPSAVQPPVMTAAAAHELAPARVPAAKPVTGTSPIGAPSSAAPPVAPFLPAPPENAGIPAPIIIIPHGRRRAVRAAAAAVLVLAGVAAPLREPSVSFAAVIDWARLRGSTLFARILPDATTSLSGSAAYEPRIPARRREAPERALTVVVKDEARAAPSRGPVETPPGPSVVSVAAAVSVTDRPFASSIPEARTVDAEHPSGSTTQSPGMASLSLNLAEVMLQHGDVASARMIFERAAADGSGQGATGVGKTYDPRVLATIASPGLKSDVGLAIRWYRRASTVMGDREADERLKALTASATTPPSDSRIR